MSTRGALYDETKDLHHAVENTPLGRAVGSGSPSPGEYAAWLSMEAQLHDHIRGFMPRRLQRGHLKRRDLSLLGLPETDCPHISAFFGDAPDKHKARGAAYVVLGADLMGGAVIAKRLKPWVPKTSFSWSPEDRRGGTRYLRRLRQQKNLVPHARGCFEAVLKTCMEAMLHAD